jgi:hypothetical protein
MSGQDYSFAVFESFMNYVFNEDAPFSGDLNRAIADWEMALRIDPNHAQAIRNLERARRQRGY